MEISIPRLHFERKLVPFIDSTRDFTSRVSYSMCAPTLATVHTHINAHGWVLAHRTPCLELGHSLISKWKLASTFLS